MGGSGRDLFSVDAITGELLVGGGRLLNFEQRSTYQLITKVSIATNPSLATTSTVTVNVTDVNEPPVFPNVRLSIDENSGEGTVIARLLATDPDADQRISYFAVGGSGFGKFLVNPVSGSVTVAPSANLDYERDKGYTLIVSARDNGAGRLQRAATVTIDLRDVNEPPQLSHVSFQLKKTLQPRRQSET